MNLYEYLNEPKGKAYRDSKIKSYSLLRIYPNVDSTRKLRGNSRIIGDANTETQNAIIDMIISISARYSLSYKEISYILLTSKRESGFNPDAAAGTTSAAGLAQATAAFISDAKLWSKKILGFVLNLDETEVFDAEKGCFALVYSFILNKSKISKYFSINEINYWKWLYILHHDGVNSLDQHMAGKHNISKDGNDVASYILEHLLKVENLLRSTQVSTSFKLSTNDGTPVANKNYVATVSLAQGTHCPSIVSTMKDPLIFFKGKTDGEGKTEATNTLAGAEIVFTILKENYKKLAMSGNADSSKQPPKEKSHKHKSNSFPANANNSTTYTVKSGDTLSVIAKSHNTTTDKLANLNNLTNVNVLHIGQVLKLSNSPRDGSEDSATIDYISRYVPNDVKQAIIKYIGIENGNTKAAISYSRSHIALPKGSTSADVDKNKNVVHIKTTTKTESIKKKQKPPEQHKTDDKGTSKPASASSEFEPVILPRSQISLALLSEKSLNTLKAIMKKAGLHKVYISSTLRTPESQAGAMYDNMRTKGIKSQLKKGYYGANGIAVVQAGVDAGGIAPEKSQEVKAAMVSKILEFRKKGQKVSRHCVTETEFNKINVFDIGKNSLGSLAVQQSFNQAIIEYAKSHPELKYISPFAHNGEGAFHFEVKQ